VTYHRIIEACKFGFALRMKLGDPTHVHIDATIKQMISKQLAAAIRHNISDAQTYPPTHYAPLYDEAKTHGTMHLSVVDKHDQVVTLMSTVNHYFGSKLISARTGIVLDNEMDDFSTPNTTNSFGLPASPMNFIQPGKRPLSSSVPTIVEKDGKFRLALGGSGGSRIITSVLEVLLRDILLESRLDAAVDAVRIHHQLYPNELSVEHGFSDKLATYLESKGHTIAWSPEELSQGTVQAVKRASDGRIHGIPCTMR
jgi:gamma-glutamyltranspeptidase/glutathione hydrolase/leukotriene-C4 hydrolase